MMSACEVKSQKDRIAANPAVKDQVDEVRFVDVNG